MANLLLQFRSIIGLVIAFIKNEKIPVLSQLCTVLVSFLRGTPLYMQLLVVFFGIPVILRGFGIEDIELSPLGVCFLAYSINAASFLSETFRASISAIPKSQLEAAYALGYDKSQAYTRIILPQALKNSLPSYQTTFIGVMQGTSVAFSIQVLEIIGRIKIGINLKGRSVEAYLIAAFVFIILNIVAEMFFGVISKKAEYKHEQKV